VTEIPEHLLKRSRERRAAIGKGDDGGDAGTSGESTSTETAPATSQAAPAPVPAATGPATRGGLPETPPPEPPRPDPPYVAAAKARRRTPIWAMFALSLLPVWGFLYVRALTEGPVEATGPVSQGEELFSNCASCHGATGAGGVGYPFSEGEVLLTFPHIQDQLRYVTFGTEGYNAAGIEVYGNPNREGGVHTTGQRGVMPAFGGQLTASEIIAVVCYERYGLAGADPASEQYSQEYETWCADEAPVYVGVENAEYDISTDTPETFELPNGESITVDPVGSTPTEGLPPAVPADVPGADTSAT